MQGGRGGESQFLCRLPLISLAGLETGRNRGEGETEEMAGPGKGRDREEGGSGGEADPGRGRDQSETKEKGTSP